MKTVWRNKQTMGFRCSAPPAAEAAEWEELEVAKLSGEERVALRIDQLGEQFVGKLKTIERELDEMKAKVLERGVAAGAAQASAVKPISLCRLFHAIGSGNWSRAEYEREVVSSPRATELRQRALGAETDTAGGYLVPPEYLATEFIPLLRSKTVLDKCGARFLNNLQGAPIMLPKQTSGATAYWVAENSSITESEQAVGQVVLAPRELAALTIVSNRLLLQADPSAEAFVREDLAQVLALKLDLGALKGRGTDGEPLGIYYTTGINTSSATGAIPNTIFDMKAECEADNVDMEDPSARVIVHPTGWNKVRKVAAAAGTPKVYAGAGHSIVDEACEMKVLKSSQLAATDAIVGKFSDLIVANWAGIVFAASNSAGTAFAKNQTYMRAIMLVDIGIRNAVSFCLNTVFGT